MVIAAHLIQTKNEILQLYENLKRSIEEFQQTSKLRCASGCGRCCENPDIFITVLEVLPLACELWQNQTALKVLVELENISGQQPCVFYQANPLKSGNGFCRVYSWRPLLCRLFGYSAKKDKYGQAQLVTCPTIKSLCSKEYAQAQINLSQGHLTAPFMQDYAMQLLNIDPYLGKEQFPINQAIKLAIEKVGFLGAQEEA